MAYKWYAVNSYSVRVGSDTLSAGYGGINLIGTNFLAVIRFEKSGVLAPPTTPVVGVVQHFYGSLDFAQMATMVDLLRHEGPISFGWSDTNPNAFSLSTGAEPTAEDET